MKLVNFGLAVGLGYALGRPEGRAQLARVGRQAADLGQRPEVARLRERGKELAVDQTQKVKEKVTARAKGATDPAGAGSDATDPAATGRRRALRTSWRPRLSRSGDAHFPPPTDPAPPAPLGGTTVVEDSRAVSLGTAAAPRPGSATPTDRS